MLRWVILILCCGWLVGVGWGSLLTPLPAWQVWSIATLAVVATAASRQSAFRLSGIFLLALLLGGLRADHAARADERVRGIWQQETVKTQSVEGIVDSMEDRGSSIVIHVQGVIGKDHSHHLPGMLRATLRSEVPVQENARIRLTGRMTIPERQADSSFDAPRFFARHGVFATMRYPKVVVLEEGELSTLTKIRTSLHANIRRALPEPAAGILSAFLLSYERDLPEELRSQITASGLAHLVAISGSHIAVLAVALFVVLTALGGSRTLASIVTAILAAIFLALVGLPASGVRSLIMIGLVLWAYLAGRLVDGLRILLLAAALMTVANPRVLLADVGFQLSVLAMWGIIVLYPIFQKVIPGRSSFFGIRSVVLMTLAAEIATAPLVLMVFQRMSLIGIFTNIVAIPLFPVILVAAVLVALFGTLPVIGPLVRIVGVGAAELFRRLVVTAAGVPKSELTTESDLSWLLPVAVLVFIVMTIISLPPVWQRMKARWGSKKVLTHPLPNV